MTIHECKHNSLSMEQMLELFPELTAEQVRTTLERASQRRIGEQILGPDPLADLIARAQDNAGLSEEEAMKLAVEVTRDARAEKARRPR